MMKSAEKRARRRPRAPTVVALGLGGVLPFLAFLIGLPFPFAWATAGLMAACAIGAWRCRNGPTKAVLVALSGLCMAFTLLEVHYGLKARTYAGQSSPRGGHTHPKGYSQADDVLGYAPTPDNSTPSQFVRGEEVLYDVTYTYDAAGLRTSPLLANGAEHGLLFFGGSFTLGEGVDDDENLPHAAAKIAGDSFCVHNFGFHEYGPHQMLAALQHGLVEQKVNCHPKFAVYLYISDHRRRAVGKAPWDKHGPKFVLRSPTEVEYVRPFDEPPERALDRLGFAVSRFLLESHLIRRKVTKRREQNTDLVVGIVATAAREFEERFPDSEFHVIVYDTEGVREDRTIQDFEGAGLRVHEISDMIPVPLPLREQDTVDGMHPNAEIYRMIAEYVMKNIVGT